MLNLFLNRSVTRTIYLHSPRKITLGYIAIVNYLSHSHTIMYIDQMAHKCKFNWKKYYIIVGNISRLYIGISNSGTITGTHGHMKI